MSMDGKDALIVASVGRRRTGGTRIVGSHACPFRQSRPRRGRPLHSTHRACRPSAHVRAIRGMRGSSAGRPRRSRPARCEGEHNRQESHAATAPLVAWGSHGIAPSIRKHRRVAACSRLPRCGGMADRHARPGKTGLCRPQSDSHERRATVSWSRCVPAARRTRGATPFECRQPRRTTRHDGIKAGDARIRVDGLSSSVHGHAQLWADVPDRILPSRRT